MSEILEGSADREDLARVERRRAVRLLLRHPFVTDDGPSPEDLALVRRHAEELKKWFRELLGYRLVVDHEMARLHKRRPPDVPPTGRREDDVRPALTRTGRPFDRRRYSLLCLVLAALESLELQTVLSALAIEVQGLAADADGVAPLDLEQFSERQGFVDAVRFLVDLGILKLADGDDTAFVRGTGDALYDVDSRRLTQMLSAAVPPSLAAGPEELAEDLYAPTEDGANRRIRHRLMRRLVEQPVLYVDELDEDERAYLNWQRSYLVRQVEEWTGLQVEVRREGLAAIDPHAGRVDGSLSDVAFPGTSHAAHAALLIADELARRSRGGEPGAAVPRSELLELAAELLRRHAWRVAYREDPSGAELLDDALDVLARLALVRRRPEGVEPLAAVARYRFVESTADAAGELFDE
ncbi:MAG: TIGR02678 family protein [Thermoanaerobaculia bacterium]